MINMDIHEEFDIDSKEITRLRNESMEAIKNYIEEQTQGNTTQLIDKTRVFLESLERLCTKYNFTQDSEYHEMGKHFSDIAVDAIDPLIEYYKFYRKENNLPNYIPSDNTFSSMQRLIKAYGKRKKVKEIKTKLESARLPINGFQDKSVFRMTKSIEKLISFISSAVLIVTILAVALFIPSPTPFQYTIFRIILSLAAGGIAAFFTGFLTVEWSNKIKAGNGFGVFIIVYLVSPAAIQALQ